MTTPSQPTSKFITVNGLQLHYLDWSNAGAPPVVCVHGYTSSAQAFNALAGNSRTASTSLLLTCVVMEIVRGHLPENTNLPI
jgi:hypothetical protein